MRFINFNYSQQDETTVTYSSQNVNYPASNIKHEFRNKTWRSSGSFVIDSTNNKIDFKESGGGAELTATITSGTYTSTTLAAEIVTQLEAVGASEYTCSYSTTTGLWTITSDGAYLSLLINTGTNTATNCLKVALGFSNTDKTGALTYTGSTIAIHTSESLVFDLRTTEDINSVCLLWPKMDGITLSSSAVVKVQANATNVWTSPAVNQTLTIDNDYEVASHFFSADQSYRYWRVLIIDPANANLYVELGVVVLGKSLDIVNPDNGFQYDIDDQSKVTTNQFGNQYVDEYPTKATLSIMYSILDYDEVQALENAYRQNGNKVPVLVTVDHEGTVFDKDHFLIYGKMTKPSSAKHINYQYFGSDLVVEEIS